MVDEEDEEEEDEGKELEEKGNTFADSSIGRRDKRKERNNTVVIKKIRGGRKPEDLASALLPHSPIKPRAILRVAPDRKKNNVAKNKKTASTEHMHPLPTMQSFACPHEKLDR